MDTTLHTVQERIEKTTEMHLTFKKKKHLSLLLGCSRADRGDAEFFLLQRDGPHNQVNILSPSRISPLEHRHSPPQGCP